MKKSDITKSYGHKAKLFSILSILATISPLIIYSIIGFVQGEVTQKLTLGLAIIVCLLFTLINIVFKRHIRSTVWILLLGIYMCLNNITILLVVVALTTILDEFVLTPIARKYKSKYNINKEIDKRIPENKE